MPRIDCFDILKNNPELSAEFISITEDMPEVEQRKQAIQIVNKLLEASNESLNKVKRKVGQKPQKYNSGVSQDAIDEIIKKYSQPEQKETPQAGSVSVGGDVTFTQVEDKKIKDIATEANLKVGSYVRSVPTGKKNKFGNSINEYEATNPFTNKKITFKKQGDATDYVVKEIAKATTKSGREEIFKAVEQSIKETPQAGSVVGANPALKDVESTDKKQLTDNELESVVGSDVFKAVQRAESQLGEGIVDRNRMIETAKRIQKADKKDKLLPEHIFEALQYEIGFPDNWQDLRNAIKKGGIDINSEAIQRQIEVGVDLPKDIVEEFKKSERYKNATPELVKLVEQSIKESPKAGSVVGSDGKSVRFEIGKKLNEKEKKEVLGTLQDAYKVNKRPYTIEETPNSGRERKVYLENMYDYMPQSGITGQKVRWYITLPDGRIAHPTEVYGNVSMSEVERFAKNLEYADDANEENYNKGLKNIKDPKRVAKILSESIDDGFIKIRTLKNDYGEIIDVRIVPNEDNPKFTHSIVDYINNITDEETISDKIPYGFDVERFISEQSLKEPTKAGSVAGADVAARNVNSVDEYVEPKEEDIRDGNTFELIRGNVYERNGRVGQTKNIQGIGLESAMPSIFGEGLMQRSIKESESIISKSTDRLKVVEAEIERLGNKDDRTTEEFEKLEKLIKEKKSLKNDLEIQTKRVANYNKEKSEQDRIDKENSDLGLVWLTSQKETARSYAEQLSKIPKAIIGERAASKVNYDIVKVTPKKIFDLTKLTDENGSLYENEAKLEEIENLLGVKLESLPDNPEYAYQLFRGRNAKKVVELLKEKGYDVVRLKEGNQDNFVLLNKGDTVEQSIKESPQSNIDEGGMVDDAGGEQLTSSQSVSEQSLVKWSGELNNIIESFTPDSVGYGNVNKEESDPVDFEYNLGKSLGINRNGYTQIIVGGKKITIRVKDHNPNSNRVQNDLDEGTDFYVNVTLENTDSRFEGADTDKELQEFAQNEPRFVSLNYANKNVTVDDVKSDIAKEIQKLISPLSSEQQEIVSISDKEKTDLQKAEETLKNAWRNFLNNGISFDGMAEAEKEIQLIISLLGYLKAKGIDIAKGIGNEVREFIKNKFVGVTDEMIDVAQGRMLTDYQKLYDTHMTPKNKEILDDMVRQVKSGEMSFEDFINTIDNIVPNERIKNVFISYVNEQIDPLDGYVAVDEEIEETPESPKAETSKEEERAFIGGLLARPINNKNFPNIVGGNKTDEDVLKRITAVTQEDVQDRKVMVDTSYVRVALEDIKEIALQNANALYMQFGEDWQTKVMDYLSDYLNAANPAQAIGILNVISTDVQQKIEKSQSPAERTKLFKLQDKADELSILFASQASLGINARKILRQFAQGGNMSKLVLDKILTEDTIQTIEEINKIMSVAPSNDELNNATMPIVEPQTAKSRLQKIKENIKQVVSPKSKKRGKISESDINNLERKAEEERKRQGVKTKMSREQIIEMLKEESKKC